VASKAPHTFCTGLVNYMLNPKHPTKIYVDQKLKPADLATSCIFKLMK
jgi:hypothetical protein